MGTFIICLIVSFIFIGYPYAKTAGEDSSEGFGCGVVLSIVAAIFAWMMFGIGK